MELAIYSNDDSFYDWKRYAWNIPIKENVNKKRTSYKTGTTANDNEYGPTYLELIEKQLSQKKSLRRYSLGARYGDVYFTRREAECMVWLLEGKKLEDIAMILGLSIRTVEYYIKNMKAKVGCRSKFNLIDLVRASDFIEEFNFQEQLASIVEKEGKQ